MSILQIDAFPDDIDNIALATLAPFPYLFSEKILFVSKTNNSANPEVEERKALRLQDDWLEHVFGTSSLKIVDVNLKAGIEFHSPAGLKEDLKRERKINKNEIQSIIVDPQKLESILATNSNKIDTLMKEVIISLNHLCILG